MQKKETTSVIFEKSRQSPMLIDLVRILRKNLKYHEKQTTKDIIVWASSGFPAIYFISFGIIPFYPQLFMHNVEEFKKNISILEGKYGISNDFCSDNKIAIARCFIPEKSSITVPEPNFLVSMNMLCNHIVMNYQLIQEHKKVPHYAIQIPSIDHERLAYTSKYRENIFSYLTNQISFLTDTIQKKFHLPFDEKKFLMAAKIYLQSMIVLEYVQTLNVYEPAPMNALDFLGFFQPLTTSDYTSAGNIDLLNFYIKLYNKLTSISAAHKIKGSNREKIRIYWEGHTFIQHSKMINSILESFDAKVVSGSFMTPNLIQPSIWEKKLPSPLTKENLAKFIEENKIIETRFNIGNWNEISSGEMMAKMLFHLNYFKHGSAHRQAVTKELIKRYNIDAVIILSAHNCRFWSLPHMQLKSFITQQLNIPCLYLEADPIDERVISEALLINRLESFLEGIAC